MVVDTMCGKLYAFYISNLLDTFICITYYCTHIYIYNYIIQIYSGITCGGVFNGELYTQRLQKLIYLYIWANI